jgi:hypothetical protein
VRRWRKILIGRRVRERGVGRVEGMKDVDVVFSRSNVEKGEGRESL